MINIKFSRKGNKRGGGGERERERETQVAVRVLWGPSQLRLDFDHSGHPYASPALRRLAAAAAAAVPVQFLASSYEVYSGRFL